MKEEIIMMPSIQIRDLPLERFRSYNLQFNQPLSLVVLKNLLSEKAFYTKYTSIKALKLDEEIQALLIEDFMRISYALDPNGIEGKSPFIDDPEVIKDGLKKMGDLIKNIYGLDSDYTIIDGLDFKTVDNVSLDKLIAGAPLFKTLKNTIDNNIFPVQIKFVVKSDHGERIINLVYPTAGDLKGKKLLLEANAEYIAKVYEALKNG